MNTLIVLFSVLVFSQAAFVRVFNNVNAPLTNVVIGSNAPITTLAFGSVTPYVSVSTASVTISGNNGAAITTNVPISSTGNNAYYTVAIGATGFYPLVFDTNTITIGANTLFVGYANTINPSCNNVTVSTNDASLQLNIGSLPAQQFSVPAAFASVTALASLNSLTATCVDTGAQLSVAITAALAGGLANNNYFSVFFVSNDTSITNPVSSSTLTGFIVQDNVITAGAFAAPSGANVIASVALTNSFANTTAGTTGTGTTGTLTTGFTNTTATTGFASVSTTGSQTTGFTNTTAGSTTGFRGTTAGVATTSSSSVIFASIALIVAAIAF